MVGERLAAVAKRITRDDTFERMVSPAIADLQRERSSGGATWRACAAVWLTMAGAVVDDFRMDARHTFDRQTIRRVLKVCGVVFVLAVIAPRSWFLADGASDRQAELFLLVVSLPMAITSLLPIATLPIAAVLAGRGHGRTILLVALVTVTLTPALQALVQTFVIPQRQSLLTARMADTVQSGDGVAITSGGAERETVFGLASAALSGQRFGPVFLDERWVERQRVNRAMDVARIVAALAFALLGSALRLRGDGAIVAVTAGIFLGYVWLTSFAVVWMAGLGFHPAFRGWLPALTVLALGAAAMALRHALDRRHPAHGIPG